jgi:starch-binding outer membrane protein, SusD/RagB family
MQTKIITIFILISVCCSCNKKKFLDEKPDTQIFVPTTLEDFRYILDNDAVFGETPVIGELSADNFYTTYSHWQSLRPKERNAYVWADNIYNGEGEVADWNYPYQQVFYANVVLDGLNHLPINEANTRDGYIIKGSALFLRAYAFYNLSQVFAPVYDASTANIPNAGIPLRLSPNIYEKTSRSTVNETYNQILADLKDASPLLPDTFTWSHRNRPSKPAAFALLARVYLSMRNYDQAGAYADSCLQLYSTLMDYNQFANLSFDKFNAETIYQSRIYWQTNLLKGNSNCIADSNLFKSYSINDLRRTVFYTTNTSPKGSYTGSIYLFSGLATDEMYLIRSECKARLGNINNALTDLNTLLPKRYKPGTFTNITGLTPQKALDTILTERRKELPFRGVRWTDLRRLHKEGTINITLKRVLNNQTYTLPPNDPRFVLPIPPDVLSLSGIPDNKRK